MKKFLIFLISLTLILSLSAQSASSESSASEVESDDEVKMIYKNFDDMDISMNIPDNWSIPTENDSTIFMMPESGKYDFRINRSYSTDYADYENYSEFSAEVLESIIENSENIIYDNYPEYDLLFYKSEFVDLGGKTAMYINYIANMKDEYTFDYDYMYYPTYFMEDIYVILDNGYFYDISAYIEDEEFTDEDIELFEKVVRSIDID